MIFQKQNVSPKCANHESICFSKLCSTSFLQCFCATTNFYDCVVRVDSDVWLLVCVLAGPSGESKFQKMLIAVGTELFVGSTQKCFKFWFNHLESVVRFVRLCWFSSACSTCYISFVSSGVEFPKAVLLDSFQKRFCH